MGKRPDGSFIAKYSFASSYEVNQKAGYSKYYPFKHDLSSIAGLGNVDLTLTGALGEGIKVKPLGDEHEIFSTDKKYDEIIYWYGEDNFNISEDEKKDLFDKILVNVIMNVMDKTYGLF